MLLKEAKEILKENGYLLEYTEADYLKKKTLELKNQVKNLNGLFGNWVFTVKKDPNFVQTFDICARNKTGKIVDDISWRWYMEDDEVIAIYSKRGADEDIDDGTWENISTVSDLMKIITNDKYVRKEC